MNGPDSASGREGRTAPTPRPRYAAAQDDQEEPDEPAAPPSHAAQAPDDEGPLWRQWPILIALLIFTVGGVVAGTGHWRRGSLLMGAGAAFAGLLRWVLPESLAGLLVVRRRWFDVSVLLIAGVGMCVLSILVPPKQ